MKAYSKKYFTRACLKVSILIVFCFSSLYVFSQQGKIDSLKKKLLLPMPDTDKAVVMKNIQWAYTEAIELDSAFTYALEALELAQKNKLPLKWQMWQFANLAFFTSERGNYSLCADYATHQLQLARQLNDSIQIPAALNNIATAYAGMNDFRKALDYLFEAKKSSTTPGAAHGYIQHIAEIYLKIDMLDSALYYNKIASHIADTSIARFPADQYMKDFAIRVFGAIYEEKGEDSLALNYYHQFINDFYQYNETSSELDRAFLGIARIFRKNKQIDSTIYYAKKALKTAQLWKDQQYVFITSDFLFRLNDSLKNESESFIYFKIASAAKDSMQSIAKVNQIQALTFNEKVREKQQAEAQAAQAARNRMIIIIATILVLLASFLIWNRIRQLRLKYKVKLEQKEVENIKARHEKDVLELEAKALRAQMNPHFIFNCLNSINRFIINHDAAKAADYLTKFAKLIRIVLEQSGKSFVLLEDELKCLQLYMDLEALRFEKPFQYKIDLNGTDVSSVMIPTMLIQPFIENAIWHGLNPKQNGVGEINISMHKYNSTLHCSICDNGVGIKYSNKTIQANKKSLGIKLTQQRLQLANNNHEEIQIEIQALKGELGENAGTCVDIKIPVIYI